MPKQSSSFAGNVLKLVTGSVFAQGLGVLVAPIVARLFAPEAFGVAALFISITGIISVVACLRYELSIMLPKTDEEAANLLGVSLFFVLIITGMSALIIFFAGDVIVGLLNSPELGKYLWLVAVSVFVSGTFLALNYWNSRTKHFGRLSIARVISSVVAQSTKLGAGFAGFVSGGVLIGTGILGQIVSTLVLGGQIWRDDRRLFKTSIRWKKMVAGLKRHKKFPVYDTWSGLMNVASQQLPALLLAFYFSPKIVGFYALGRTVLGMPMGLVGGAVAQVFFQKASEANQRANLDEVVKEVFQRLVALGIFPFLLIAIIGKGLFLFVFGEQWGEAGVFVQLLSPWLFFLFISSPLTTIFSILEAQKELLFFNVVLLLSRIASLVIGGLVANPRIAVGLFSVVGSIACSWITFWIAEKAGCSSKTIVKILVRNLLLSIPFLLIIFVSYYIIQPCFWVTLFICGLCSVFYYALAVYRDVYLRILFVSYFKKASKSINLRVGV